VLTDHIVQIMQIMHNIPHQAEQKNLQCGAVSYKRVLSNFTSNNAREIDFVCKTFNVLVSFTTF